MIVSMKRLRNSARGRVNTAVQKGELQKASVFTCVDCGNPAQCWEHRDYTKPLDVEPVCKRCDSIRGAGFPPPDHPDMEVEWITKPLSPIVMRWGWVDWRSRITHHFNVTGDVGVAVCGLRTDYITYGISAASRMCKRCAPKPKRAR